MVRKRSGFRKKALNFAIVAVRDPWSGTQNFVVVNFGMLIQMKLDYIYPRGVRGGQPYFLGEKVFLRSLRLNALGVTFDFYG